MAGVWPEERLREQVEAAGAADRSVAELLQEFGYRRCTGLGLRKIESLLAEAGVGIVPTLKGAEPDDVVRLIPAAMPAGVSTGAAGRQVATEAAATEAASVKGDGGHAPPMAATLEWLAGGRPSSPPARRPSLSAERALGSAPPARRRRPDAVPPRPSAPPRRPRHADRPRPRDRPKPPPKPSPTPAERSARRRRRLSTGMLVVGIVLLLEAALTVAWKEPISAIQAAREQSRLNDELAEAERRRDAIERSFILTAYRDRRKRRLAYRRAVRRLRRLAAAGNSNTGTGNPVGRLSIAKLGLNTAFVQSTDPSVLTKGPGHYTRTALPGERGTVGIAGHRTTYGAPFRRIDQLVAGDRIDVTMPYGRFVYSVQGQRIVAPGTVDAFGPARFDRLVLTACHPVFSNAQRILVYARLVRSPIRRPRPGVGGAISAGARSIQ